MDNPKKNNVAATTITNHKSFDSSYSHIITTFCILEKKNLHPS